MTRSDTSASIHYDYISIYRYASHRLDDLLSDVWLWDPPTALPTMYVQKPMAQVIEPHIKTRLCHRFLGHRFGLGGSKK